MTEQARDWLPVEASDRGAVREPLASAVAEWSAAWFADAGLCAARFTPAKGAASENDSWRVWPSTVAVQCSGRALTRLLDGALDADVERLASSDIDRRLIGEFERRLLGDLVRRVGRVFSLEGGDSDETARSDDPLRPSGGLIVEIADSHGDRLLALALPLKALLPTIKRSLPKAERRADKLTPLRGALADTSISVQAILGAAQISLPDLQGLAPGDVLVLDTQLDDTAALSIVGSGQVFAHAKLTPAGEDMSLTLQA